MLMEKATDVRKEWSLVCDDVIHKKPKFIQRTRDRMWLSSLETMSEILKAYSFSADLYQEEDDSITLSLNEIDLVENGKNEEEARLKMGAAILEYAVEFYTEYELYSRSINRKCHVPYVFKALIIDDAQRLGETITCQVGKN